MKKHKILVPQEEDISLKERIRRANELHLNKEEPVIRQLGGQFSMGNGICSNEIICGEVI